ncbi:MAG: Crp/Fnr family transcriptional regulator [Chitinophagaceae bacterium]|nr:Crp/Fnr family transcriptional regulator [Chitinophagaceae bacterium]
MLIPHEQLLKAGGIQKVYEKDEYIFHEGDTARYFYQIITGRVKMGSANDDGKIFVQGEFTDNDCFGEPPMLINEKYPASAMAITKSYIIKISATAFLQLLEKNEDLKMALIYCLARRVYNKSVTSKEIINHRPEHRILAFLMDYKKDKSPGEMRILIPYTRQEIADFTGLRVETVIRALTLMHQQGKVEIIKRKLYF